MFSSSCTGKAPLVLGDGALPKGRSVVCVLIWALCEHHVSQSRKFGVAASFLIEILL